MERPALNRYERQKEESRQQILRAALLTFRDKTYHAANVEDVITRAEISRATFYKHFKSKLAVAEALLEQMSRHHDAAYDQLGAIESVTLESLGGWIANIVSISESNKLLLAVLAQLVASVPQVREAAELMSVRRIERLSTTIPAFRGALEDGAESSHHRDRILLLLYEIDTIMFRLIVQEWKVDRPTAIAFMARQILNVIDEMGTAPSAEILHLPPPRRTGTKSGRQSGH